MEFEWECMKLHLSIKFSIILELASSPDPSPPRRGVVLTVCTCAKWSVTFYVKSSVHLPCLYAEDYICRPYAIDADTSCN